MVTEDSFLEGRLTLEQPAKGYRVNVDSVHLAYFSARSPAHHVCDLGAGVGAVGSMIHALRPVRHLTFVERDPTMLSSLRRNVRGTEATVIETDVSMLPSGLEADLVVMNPPYFSRGREAQGLRKDARFGPLLPFVAAARRVLRKRGRVALCYPAADLAMVFETLRSAGLEPKEVQLVHAQATAHARLALVLAKPAKPGGLVILPPRYDA